MRTKSLYVSTDDDNTSKVKTTIDLIKSGVSGGKSIK